MTEHTTTERLRRKRVKALSNCSYSIEKVELDEYFVFYVLKGIFKCRDRQKKRPSAEEARTRVCTVYRLRDRDGVYV